jgi:hypothetical protein
MIKDKSRKLAYEAIEKRYKAGDVIKIKSRRVIRGLKKEGYNLPGFFNNTMERYCGRVGKIDYCSFGKADLNRNVYKIDIDDGRWNWTSDMFELSIGIMENE